MRIYRLTLGFAIVAASLMAFAALNTNTRKELRAVLTPEFRKVVSVAEADLGGDGRLWKVVKVATRDSIWLEVYRTTEAGVVEVVEKLQQPQRRDGYYSFQGQAANLVIEDVDNDGQLEILSPSFNMDLVGKLDIYRYEPMTKSLHLVAN